jgi:hypothetical protein
VPTHTLATTSVSLHEYQGARRKRSTALKHALPDMARWDDLPDDVQEVISASVRRNLEACLAEKTIRLESLVKETEICLAPSPPRLRAPASAGPCIYARHASRARASASRPRLASRASRAPASARVVVLTVAGRSTGPVDPRRLWRRESGIGCRLSQYSLSVSTRIHSRERVAR